MSAMPDTIRTNSITPLRPFDTERTTLQEAVLSGVIEILKTHNAVYRAADTASIFGNSLPLVTTKHVIKAFQILPDTLENVQEYLRNGRLENPFAATAIFIRNIVVEFEVAACLGLIGNLSSGGLEEDHRLVSDMASMMHIVVMGFVACSAFKQLQANRNLSRSALTRPIVSYRRREAQLAIATAVTKVAQQSFILLHTPYHNVVKLMTLIFNVCAVVSCLFSTKALRKHYSNNG